MAITITKTDTVVTVTTTTEEKILVKDLLEEKAELEKANVIPELTQEEYAEIGKEVYLSWFTASINNPRLDEINLLLKK